jgi:hypothetical protein
VPGLSVSTTLGGTPGAPTVAVQGNLAAALAALVGNSTAAAATLLAIQTLVADNIGNTVTLQQILQTIINVNTPIVSTTTTVVLTVSENPNQANNSPN